MLLNPCRQGRDRPVQQGVKTAVMPHQWIIDVLIDLQGFARQNDMPDLAQHLDQTLALAARELARAGRPLDEAAPEDFGCWGPTTR